jgi:hypothetical protein
MPESDAKTPSELAESDAKTPSKLAESDAKITKPELQKALRCRSASLLRQRFP